MELILQSVDYHNCPVEHREKVSLTEEQQLPSLDDDETKEIVSQLDDKKARIETTAERIVFSALGCGCHAPAGVFAQINGSNITIWACFSDPDGGNFREHSLSGPIADSAKLAQSLADKLR